MVWEASVATKPPSRAKRGLTFYRRWRWSFWIQDCRVFARGKCWTLLWISCMMNLVDLHWNHVREEIIFLVSASGDAQKSVFSHSCFTTGLVYLKLEAEGSGHRVLSWWRLFLLWCVSYFWEHLNDGVKMCPYVLDVSYIFLHLV